jgi:hypothetical protein
LSAPQYRHVNPGGGAKSKISDAKTLTILRRPNLQRNQLLNEGREFAELLKLLKKPSIISNEAADRLEEKAQRLKERADLMELEASGMRTAVAP